MRIIAGICNQLNFTPNNFRFRSACAGKQGNVIQVHIGVERFPCRKHCVEAFPHNFQIYKEACTSGELFIGSLLAVDDSNLLYGTKLIINSLPKHIGNTHLNIPILKAGWRHSHFG